MKRSIGLLIVAVLALTLKPEVVGAGGFGRSPLDGTWKWTWTRAELLKHDCATAPDTAKLAGSYVATFANGHVTSRNLTNRRGDSVLRASVAIRGNIASFVFATRGIGIVPGRTYALRWSIYRDRLQFSELPGRAVLTCITIKPLTRVH